MPPKFVTPTPDVCVQKSNLATIKRPVRSSSDAKLRTNPEEVLYYIRIAVCLAEKQR